MELNIYPPSPNFRNIKTLSNLVQPDRNCHCNRSFAWLSPMRPVKKILNRDHRTTPNTYPEYEMWFLLLLLFCCCLLVCLGFCCWVFWGFCCCLLLLFFAETFLVKNYDRIFWNISREELWPHFQFCLLRFSTCSNLLISELGNVWKPSKSSMLAIICWSWTCLCRSKVSSSRSELNTRKSVSIFHLRVVEWGVYVGKGWVFRAVLKSSFELPAPRTVRLSIGKSCPNNHSLQQDFRFRKPTHDLFLTCLTFVHRQQWLTCVTVWDPFTMAPVISDLPPNHSGTVHSRVVCLPPT